MQKWKINYKVIQVSLIIAAIMAIYEGESIVEICFWYLWTDQALSFHTANIVFRYPKILQYFVSIWFLSFKSQIAFTSAIIGRNLETIQTYPQGYVTVVKFLCKKSRDFNDSFWAEFSIKIEDILVCCRPMFNLVLYCFKFFSHQFLMTDLLKNGTTLADN